MKEKAEKLRNEIDKICGKFYYEKDESVIPKALNIAKQVEEYCSFFLQGNLFGMETAEYCGLHKYVVQVLEDFVTAAQQEDTVLMLDTLDYGLRELLEIFRDKETGEGDTGKGATA